MPIINLIMHYETKAATSSFLIRNPHSPLEK